MCKCEYEQYKPGNNICEREEKEGQFGKDIMEQGSLKVGKRCEDRADHESGGIFGDWDYSDKHRYSTPELLMCVSGERGVPPRTVDTTENGGKAFQEEDVVPLGITWNVERRDMCNMRVEGN